MDSYGLFAQAPDGSLRRLDGDREWEIRTWGQRSSFQGDVNFVVYDRSLLGAAPLEDMIQLYRVPGVRNEIRADGRVERVADARWATVVRDEFQVPLEFGPHQGKPDAVRARPRAPLEPGLYTLRLRTEHTTKTARVGVDWPQVDHESYAAAHCVDRIHGDRTTFRLCEEEPPGAGLRINLAEPRRSQTFAGSELIIEGVVINVSDRPQGVPPIVGTIADERGTPLRNWTFDAGLGELAPGRSASFREVVRDAPTTPLRINLTFAETVAAR